MSTPARPSTLAEMSRRISSRADPRGVALADRHYSRKTAEHPHVPPPGRCLVLLTPSSDAVWVSSWPRPAYTHARYAQGDAWLWSLFRHEGAARSSDLIIQAIAATHWVWGDCPALGIITFVDPANVQSPNPGYCFTCAGFKRVGSTRSGLPVLYCSRGICRPRDLHTELSLSSLLKKIWR
jgi:hypothetical protein